MRALLWRFVEWRLARTVPPNRLDAVLGDLTADWASRARTRGRLRANAWLLREARSVASAYRLHSRDVARRRSTCARLAADLAADLRYASRLLRRQPGFAAVAILSLALGIGMNTLVFSVVNALILRPLPVGRPDELVFVQTSARPSLSFPLYRDIRDRSDAFAGAIGYRIAPMNMDHQRNAARVWGYLATGNYFDVLGVQPAVGAFFHQADDRPPAPSPVAVLSYDCWIGRFGGDRAVVGREIRLNGAPYRVLGVAPRGFIGTELFYRPEIWVPMTMQPQIEARSSWLDSRRTGNTWVVARLKPGAARALAQARLDALAAALAVEHPDSDKGLHLTLSEPGLAGDALGPPMKAFALGVQTLAALVLVMACVNLAVGLSARGTERRRELAVRLSMGASAGRLARQLLTETFVLAAAGGTVGLALAIAAARALSLWRLPVELPVQFDVAADWRVFLFALGTAAASGLLFGVAPARQALRTDPSLSLKGAARATGTTIRAIPARDALVGVQVALCLVLMAGSLLAIRGLRASLTQPLGLEPRGVAMVGVDLGLAGYDEPRAREFVDRALEAIRGIPGVTAAACSDSLPLSIDQSTSTVFPEHRPDLDIAAARTASRYRVSPEFFRTLGMRLHRGRPIDRRDTAERPRVAVVNQTFARAILGAADPVGRRFRYGRSGDWIEVVGLVEDGKYVSLTESPRPAVFESMLQSHSNNVRLLARTSVPAADAVSSMRTTIARLDPALGHYEAQSLDDMLALARFPNRAAAIALTAFGALAMLLAVTGVYGTVSHAVARRRKEIGIRIAIGAGAGQVLRLVLRRTLACVAGGAMAGVALVLLAGRILSSVVYGVSPRDPVALAAVAAVFLTAGAVACWLPARHALAIDPVSTLKSE